MTCPECYSEDITVDYVPQKVYHCFTCDHCWTESKSDYVRRRITGEYIEGEDQDEILYNMEEYHDRNQEN